jgi:hypothetical protein
VAGFGESSARRSPARSTGAGIGLSGDGWRIQSAGLVPPSVAGRMRAYLAAHPGQQFASDEESGIVAVVIPHGLEDPEVIASAGDLIELLDSIEAPSAAELS